MRLVESVHGGTVPARDQMTVGVYGDLDRVMAELIANIGKALALADEKRGVRVPQDVRVCFAPWTSIPTLIRDGVTYEPVIRHDLSEYPDDD